MAEVGRHSTSNAGLVTAAVVAGVVLVAGGGAWAMGAVLGDDPPPTAAPSTSTSVIASSSASPSPTASTSPSPAPSASDTAGARTARAACVAQVRAAEGIATAVAGSALHWQQHTDAYLAKTGGRITLAETQRRYAASKAYGLADEKAVAATTKAFMATGAACADAARALPGDAAITACTTRLTALGVVRTTGTQVQNEWSTHMRMMSNKAHTDAGAYHQTWVKAVAGARKSLIAHANAATAATKAPACG